MLGIIDESDIIKIGRKITTARYGYVNHTNTLCHICNVNNTRILPNGRPHWLYIKQIKMINLIQNVIGTENHIYAEHATIENVENYQIAMKTG